MKRLAKCYQFKYDNSTEQLVARVFAYGFAEGMKAAQRSDVDDVRVEPLPGMYGVYIEGKIEANRYETLDWKKLSMLDI